MKAIQGSCSTEKIEGLTHKLIRDPEIIMVNIPQRMSNEESSYGISAGY
jgi:hypothetical protein